MQWCRDANLWRSALYNVETVFHEVPTNQPCPQIITWVWLKHYSSVFFFPKIVLSVRVIIAERHIAASKAGLQALLPSFPSPSFCLALFTLIVTVEPGPRLLDTGRIPECPVSVRVAYVNDDDIISHTILYFMHIILASPPANSKS